MDLTLDYGDLSIQKIGEDVDGTSYFDLVLDSPEQTISRIVKRTLQTPFRYIKTAVQDRTLNYLDADYGNPLYRKLAEPFTMSFLLEAKTDIENALSSLANIPGLLVNSVNVSSFSMDTLDVEITYTYNNQTTTSQLFLSL